jgi:type IV pilus assembly protein PilA
MTVKNQQKGFTIIELLIVIVVIGILAAIGFVAYGNVTKSARDSDREADAGSIAKKAEEIYSEKGQYPADIAEIAALDGIDAKTLTSPNGRAAVDGGATLGSCTTEPVSVATDEYCYIVTTDQAQMEVRHWDESENITKSITGVNN